MGKTLRMLCLAMAGAVWAWAWAASGGDADGSARLAACNPHDNAGAVCSRCGRKSFLVRKLYDNRHWDKTRYSTVELAVYSAAAANPDAQGCCLTYVTEGEAIDLTDNLDGNGERLKLNGVHDIEQTNHFMVPFNDKGWAYLKADLQENGAIRVTGEFGPYHPEYEAEAPNGKDRRMTLSTAGLLNGQTFYVIERSPGDYEPTGYVYVGDDAEADPRVDSSAMTTTWKLDQAVMDGTDPVPENEPNHVPATVEAGALYLTGTTTGEGTTVFVVNSFDMTTVSPTYFQFLEVTASVPWDGRVSFFFDPGEPAEPLPVWNPPFLSIVATDTATGSNYVSSASALSAESPERLDAALHARTDDDTLVAPFTVTWDMSALVPDDFSTTGMVFTVDYLALPEYCVIDLTGGTNGASPAVSYLDAPPEGGWTDRYKTELLPMRLVPPETEGARPFYCALFETTQKQWELVTGGTPSAFPGATRPVERVSWNDIRGDAETCDWPAADAVDEDSFVGILRRRTGLSALDLPTEAQWEFACRGWRTTDYGYGHVPNGDGMWFKDNSGGETHEAGTRTTNFFGLHDMHGNVAEWCLDRASSTGPERVLRGGGWQDSAPDCTSSSRSGHDPSTGDGHCGFRLVRNLPRDSESERSPEAEPGGLRVGTVPTQDEEDPTIVSYSCASEAIALSRVVPHTVIFTWHGGSFETNYPHGTALWVPETPAPYTEGGTNYSFTGWSPEVAAVVTNDAAYAARYAIVPEVAVSCAVGGAGGTNDEMTVTVSGPADCDGVADVAVYADETGAGEPVWATNGVALAAGAAEFSVSPAGGVLPARGQHVFATYLPNDRYAGATASNRVMGTSAVAIGVAATNRVDDDIAITFTRVNSTGEIAVALLDANGEGTGHTNAIASGQTTWTIAAGGLPAGDYAVTAVLAGDADYLGSGATNAFKVRQTPDLHVDDIDDVVEGEPATITATMNADATEEMSVDCGNIHSRVPLSDGEMTLLLYTLTPGNHTATVGYPGDGKYLAASTNVSFTVFPRQGQEEVDGVVWYYAAHGDGTAVVTGVASNHATGNLTMPETLGGWTVTEVGDAAFWNCTNLTGMAIAGGVTNIMGDAFASCTGLTDMTIPDLVTDIGRYAFAGCIGLTNVTVGAGVTNIENSAFYDCEILATVSLPEGLVSIGDFAFEHTALADVRIPDSVADIGGKAFYLSTSLTNVRLGTGIESVGENAFAYCFDLAAVWAPVEQEGTGLLDAAGLPAGCEIHYYGTQTVTFDPNGGTCATATNAYAIGEAYGALPEAGRDGHDFAGWWDDAAGVEVTTNSIVTEKAARTLVARWEAIPSADIDGVKWLFRTNEVGGATVAGAIPADGDLAMPDELGGVPVTAVGDDAFRNCTNLTGMTVANGVTNIGAGAFAGCDSLTNAWIGTGIESVGAGAFTNCPNLATVWAPVEQQGAGLLDAAGLPEGCEIRYHGTQTVTFHANGGTCGTRTKPCEFGAWKTYGALPGASRSGWEFLGWFDAAGGGTKVTGASVVTETTARTLWAHWRQTAPPNTWTVAYNANGGTGTMGVQTIRRGTTARLTANAFRRAGYTFAGWAETKDGAVAHEDRASVKDLAPAGGTVTFYARWAKTKYTVAFDANGGTGRMAAQGMTYGTAAKLRKNAFQRSGWVFAGWARWQNGAVVYADQASVKNLRTDGKTTTLYAKWAKPTYTVTYKANGGTGTMAAQTIQRGTKAWLRYNAFRRAGHTFLGWSETWNGAVAHADHAAVTDLAPTGGNVTFFARWAKTKYTVAFDANGGTGRMAAQGMAYGTSANLRKNAFARNGWVFVGWARWQNGAVVYADGASVRNLRTDGKTTTLYAKWAKKTYTVEFDANGGEVSKRHKAGGQTFEYGKGKRLKTNPFIRHGCFFVGWATTRDGEVAYADEEWVKNLRTDGGTTTLYARWAKKTYTVAFDANGGKGTMAKQLYIYGHAAQLNSNRFTRDGFVFAGWAKSPNGPVAYANGGVLNNLRVDGGTTTLYAKWQARAAATASAQGRGAGERTAAGAAAGLADGASGAGGGVRADGGNEARGTARVRVASVTTSDGTDGSAVVDGDEKTGWAPRGTGWAWVVLALAEPVEVPWVEVSGNGLPEGIRVLLSEDAEEWSELAEERTATGWARYVWVAWEAGKGTGSLREVRVREGTAGRCRGK